MMRQFDYRQHILVNIDMSYAFHAVSQRSKSDDYS